MTGNASKNFQSNRLLALLSPDDFAAITDHLEPLELARGDVLIRPDRPIESVVFPLSGIVSIVATTEDHHRIEIGIIGCEGMTDGSLLTGIDRIPHELFVQIAGEGLRIDAENLIRLCDERPSLRNLLARWVHVLALQTAQTTVANSGFNVEARLARWLLMCQDRLGGNQIGLTHEFIGIMLAVRRSSVTLATQVLEGTGIIKAERGLITIRNRAALEDLAGSSYGAPEREYERIIGALGAQRVLAASAGLVAS